MVSVDQVLFVLASYLSASLLFFVEPMVARMLMPLLGGSAAVWTTCLVFFQTVLVAGYAYAHGTLRRLGPRRQAFMHGLVLLLPLAVMPLEFPETDVASWDAQASPVLPVLGLLTRRVGLPFFVLSTSAPLLQAWLASSGGKHAKNPYALYVASNLGSLVSVFAYPLVLDRWLGVHDQSRLLQGGYLVYVALMVGCAVRIVTGRGLGAQGEDEGIAERRSSEASASGDGHDAAPEEAVMPTPKTWALWVALAAVPSSLLMGVTSYISTKIAPIPLIWSVPLAIYLASFIFVFSPKNPLSAHGASRTLWIFLSGVLFLFLVVQDAGQLPWISMGLHLGTLFLATMLCHGRLAEGRPDPRFLTQFYLAMSVGGALGGVFNGLLAPLLFRSIYEYPLTLLALAFLRLPRERGQTEGRLDFGDLVWASLMGGLVLGGSLVCRFWIGAKFLWLCIAYAIPVFANGVVAYRPRRFALGGLSMVLAVTLVPPVDEGILHLSRSFFSTIVVKNDVRGQFNSIVHGDTIHGRQWRDPGKKKEPLSYYSHEGPLGDLFSAAIRPSQARRIAAVGLGAGTVAAYANPADSWTFFEIDPEVVKVAQNQGLFTYLSDAFPQQQGLRIEVGDGRLKLQNAQDGSFDAILLDAFSSDAIPVHLLTVEAWRIYMAKLSPTGLVAVHISNRWFDLRNPLATTAEELSLHLRCRRDMRPSLEERFAATWCALASGPAALQPLEGMAEWKPVTATRRVLWTDDKASVMDAWK
jgi:hypothetical protein